MEKDQEHSQKNTFTVIDQLNKTRNDMKLIRQN